MEFSVIFFLSRIVKRWKTKTKQTTNENIAVYLLGAKIAKRKTKISGYKVPFNILTNLSSGFRVYNRGFFSCRLVSPWAVSFPRNSNQFLKKYRALHISEPTIVTVPTKLGKRLFITDQLELRLSAPGVSIILTKTKINLSAWKLLFNVSNAENTCALV